MDKTIQIFLDTIDEVKREGLLHFDECKVENNQVIVKGLPEEEDLKNIILIAKKFYLKGMEAGARTVGRLHGAQFLEAILKQYENM